MGKKKRDHNTLNHFCYYCDKEYEHKDTLLEHQKDRHFSCLKCPKKFSTAGSMSVHMMSVHREPLARVPNAKVGRDSLEISIYGMEGVPTIVIQEKMISKLKRKRQLLQDDIQKRLNLTHNLNPKNIKELKISNDFCRIFKNYTTNMESLAGIRYYAEQPAEAYEQRFPPPPEEDKSKLEQRRESKFKRKEEEEPEMLHNIMKEEMKQMYKEQVAEETNVQIPVLNLNIQKQKESKKKGKQEVMTFVSKLSPEEKIAKMDKYKYDEKKIKSRLKDLKMNIEDRLNAFLK